VDGFKRILILLNLERLISGCTTNNFTHVILNSLLVYGDLTLGEINKLICFGSNGVVVFTSVCSGVTTVIFHKVVLLMLVVHCVAHMINLVVQTFSKQPLVQKIERLLHSTYTYFSSSPKRYLSNANLLNCWRQRGTRCYTT
jgi:hypothetical protein